MDIKKFIVDGEYIRGNAEHAQEIKKWLKSKGAIDCDNYYCSDSHDLFAVNAISKKIEWTPDDNELLSHIIRDCGTEIKLSIDRFDPNTLKPFDKVLVRDTPDEDWEAVFFSHIIVIDSLPVYICGNDQWNFCIPYNDDTKHLVGIMDEAPEYYRY